MDERQPASSDEAAESGALDEAGADPELERSGEQGVSAEAGALDEEDEGEQ